MIEKLNGHIFKLLDHKQMIMMFALMLEARFRTVGPGNPDLYKGGYTVGETLNNSTNVFLDHFLPVTMDPEEFWSIKRWHRFKKTERPG